MLTVFQKQVHKALSEIPRGRVTTYSLLSNHLKTKAVRAVATAVGKNPDYPRVPCHRVVLSDGQIGKYSGTGGVKRKIKLLQQEGVEVESDRIVDFENKLYSF